jgi:hypothetical protein
MFKIPSYEWLQSLVADLKKKEIITEIFLPLKGENNATQSDYTHNSNDTILLHNDDNYQAIDI